MVVSDGGVGWWCMMVMYTGSDGCIPWVPMAKFVVVSYIAAGVGGILWYRIMVVRAVYDGVTDGI